MKRVHIALGSDRFDDSCSDLRGRLDAEPVVVVPGTYALWRTDLLNLSLRQVPPGTGGVRHLGFEDDKATGFASSKDPTGVEWEHFSPDAQLQEILSPWPNAPEGVLQEPSHPPR